jgi:hypothetical protein
MKPHNSNPAEAFAICCQQTCPLLYQGKLHKCSTAGLIKETLAKVGNPNMDLWEPVIDHGIGTDCSDTELERFLDNFGKPNDICRQCPTLADTNAKIIHIDNVSTKKIK